MLYRMVKVIEIAPLALVSFSVTETFARNCFNHFNSVDAPPQIWTVSPQMEVEKHHFIMGIQTMVKRVEHYFR